MQIRHEQLSISPRRLSARHAAPVHADSQRSLRNDPHWRVQTGSGGSSVPIGSSSGIMLTAHGPGGSGGSGLGRPQFPSPFGRTRAAPLAVISAADVLRKHRKNQQAVEREVCCQHK